MKRTFLFLAFLLLLRALSVAQYQVILDTDMDSDVDDVEALAMLHTLADEKKIDLLGVIVTSDDPYAALCTDAINTYFKRPHLPIGVLKNQTQLKNHSKYTKQIAEEFPHRLQSQEQALDATALYRQLLSQSPDTSVVIITIGHLTNLQNLLQSKADKYSSLSGKELVRKKAAKWLCMGGMFPQGKEANFYRPDPGSTVYCLKAWEKQVVFAGWEIGEKIKTGGEYLQSKLTANSPVYRAYQLYNNFQGRASWDQVAVFLLINKAEKYFEIFTNGYCQVEEDGSNHWIAGKESMHAYVRFKPGIDFQEIGRVMDDMAIH